MQTEIQCLSLLLEIEGISGEKIDTVERISLHLKIAIATARSAKNAGTVFVCAVRTKGHRKTATKDTR